MAYIGEVRTTAFTFAPNGWALCNGQLLSIAANIPLYQVIGTAFGGNGTTTFALPDLRGRVPVMPGQGPGMSTRERGEMGGAETHTLTVSELPMHTHKLRANSGNGTTDKPDGNVPARNPAAIPQYAATVDANLETAAVGTAGADQPHNNMQPYLVINYVIALQGTAPTP
jgi:microcystin-dependent protein